MTNKKSKPTPARYRVIGHIDPTHTGAMRRKLGTILRMSYTKLKQQILTTIGDQDLLAIGGSYLINAFCPTGKGGGIDATCSPKHTAEAATGLGPRTFHGTGVDVINSIKADGIKPESGQAGVAAYTSQNFTEAMEYAVMRARTRPGGLKEGDKLVVVEVHNHGGETLRAGDIGGQPVSWVLWRNGVPPEQIKEVHVFDAVQVRKFLRSTELAPGIEAYEKFRVHNEGTKSYVIMLWSGGVIHHLPPPHVHITNEFHPDQKRDDHGRWTKWGPSASSKDDFDWFKGKFLHALKERPDPKPTEPSKAKVEINTRLTPEGVKNAQHSLFGRELTNEEFASLVGAPDDAVVKVNLRKDYIGIVIYHPEFKAERRVEKDDNGNTFIENSSFFMNEGHGGKGTGTRVFAKQVEYASKLGVSKITTYAVGDYPQSKVAGGSNGYYTWPRFGYDTAISKQTIPPQALAEIKEKFPHCETLSDVMMTEQGQQWWKQNGSSVSLEFDLKPGSRSIKTFHSYLHERDRKRAVVSNMSVPYFLQGNGVENPDLSPEEDMALDAAWDIVRSAVQTHRTPPNMNDHTHNVVDSSGHVHDERGRFAAVAGVKHDGEATPAQGSGDATSQVPDAAKPDDVASVFATTSSQEYRIARERVSNAEAEHAAAELALKTDKVSPVSDLLIKSGTALTALRAAKEAMAEEERKDLMAVLLRKGGGYNVSSTVAKGTAWKQEEYDRMTAAHDFLNAVLARSHAPMQDAMYTRSLEGRAEYDVAVRTIKLNRSDDTDTYIHEWGHHLENQIPGAKDTTAQFLSMRCGAETPTDLRKKFGSRFSRGENGRADDFGKLFTDPAHAFYVGKTYKGGDSEALSMGVELLYKSPKMFAQRDPQYFNMVVSILQNTHRGNPGGSVTNIDKGRADLHVHSVQQGVVVQGVSGSGRADEQGVPTGVNNGGSSGGSNGTQGGAGTGGADRDSDRGASGGRSGAGVLGNSLTEYHSSDDKLKRFRQWLRGQMGITLVGDALLRHYIDLSYRKGLGRAYTDSTKGRKPTVDVIVAVNDPAYFSHGAARGKGAEEEFIRAAFSKRPTVEKVKLLASRTFSELEDINSRMATRMSRVLVEGLVQGRTARQIARDMVRAVDLEMPRALTIVKSELVRAHAEAQLDALHTLGVKGVSAMVEWSTAGDGKVCKLCKPLEGAVLPLAKARGMLPRHPNCRCAWKPVTGTAPKRPKTHVNRPLTGTKPKRQPTANQAAQTPTRGLVGPANAMVYNHTLGSVVDTNLLTFSVLLNAFCATGEGGGIDPHCGKDASGAPKAEGTGGSAAHPHAYAPPKNHEEAIAAVRASGVINQFMSGQRQGSEGMSAHEDHFQGALTKQMGFDKLPAVTDTAGVDKVIKAGGIEGYRGLTDPKFTEDFKSGEMFHGKGIYGNGTYLCYTQPGASDDHAPGGKLHQFDPAIGKVGGDRGSRAHAAGVAAMFAGPNGAAMRMAIHPSARMGDYDTIESGQRQFLKDIDAKITAKAGTLGHKWVTGSKKDKDELKELDTMKKLYSGDKGIGRYALTMGYDAYVHPGVAYAVLLNRSKVVVDKTDFYHKGSVNQ